MKLTGDLIDRYHRSHIDVEDLNEWAYSLLESGHEGEAILTAASCRNLTWQEVRFYFKKILKDLNITEDLDNNLENVKEKVFIEEYKLGLRLGAELLHKFDSLRKEIGFYDMIGLTIIGDDYKGKCKSGYHTLDRKLYGDELEKEIRIHLKRSGKV